MAAFTGVAGAGDGHRLAVKRRLEMMKVAQFANTWHALGEEVDGARPLQRQVVQVVVEQYRDVAPDRAARQPFVPCSTAMHDHEHISD